MSNQTQPKDVAYALYIINKAGTLLYQRDFVSLPRLKDDDYIFLGSTFHSLHVLSSHGVSPIPIASSSSSSSSSTSSSTSGKLQTTRGGATSTSSATPVASSTAASSSLSSLLPSGVSSAFDLIPIEALPGITSIEARDFRLDCFQTLTGLKFLMSGSPSHSSLEAMCKQVCLLYTDYVLKNPFYKVDMPIRWYASLHSLHSPSSSLSLPSSYLLSLTLSLSCLVVSPLSLILCAATSSTSILTNTYPPGNEEVNK